MAKQPNAVCTVCGKAYWRQTTHLARSRFCSNTCKQRGGGFGKGQLGDEIRQEELERLYYQEQLSMQQIAERFGCSVHKVDYWMKRFGFDRRSWSEATYVYRNPEGDPFQIRMPETSEEWHLFDLAIGIYMGEGSKKGFDVSVANTNPKIHLIFISFLEKVCGIDKTQLKAYLNIYDDCDVEDSIIWWAEQLGLESRQFVKTTIRKSRGGTHIQKSERGTLKVYLNNVKLKAIILKWCEEYYQQFS